MAKEVILDFTGLRFNRDDTIEITVKFRTKDDSPRAHTVLLTDPNYKIWKIVAIEDEQAAEISGTGSAESTETQASSGAEASAAAAAA